MEMQENYENFLKENILYSATKIMINEKLFLILFDYYKWEKTKNQGVNLFCINSDGCCVWQAFMRNKEFDDLIVSIVKEANSYFANSWQCYRFIINIDDGSLIYDSFTK
jgi:hypothetical protein